jgi:hypothetical protein
LFLLLRNSMEPKIAALISILSAMIAGFMLYHLLAKIFVKLFESE